MEHNIYPKRHCITPASYGKVWKFIFHTENCSVNRRQHSSLGCSSKSWCFDTKLFHNNWHYTRNQFCWLYWQKVFLLVGIAWKVGEPVFAILLQPNGRSDASLSPRCPCNGLVRAGRGRGKMLCKWNNLNLARVMLDARDSRNPHQRWFGCTGCRISAKVCLKSPWKDAPVQALARQSKFALCRK